MQRYRLVLSGAGGQGVITAAVMLAEAAVLHARLNAVQSQVYGAEARGGATRADVILSDAKILFPKVVQPNALVCLTQAAYNKYAGLIRPGGLLITDRRHVVIEKKVDARQVELPLHETVRTRLGALLAYNVCMLGALVGLIGMVPAEAIEKILAAKMPPALLDVNRQALLLGLGLAKEAHRP